MGAIDREKAREAVVEAALELWARTVAGNVPLGYGGSVLAKAEYLEAITPARKIKILGQAVARPLSAKGTDTMGGARPDHWPEVVEEIECCVTTCMPEQVRAAIVRFYVRRRSVNSISRELHVCQSKVYQFLDEGHARVDGWLAARNVI